MCTCYVNRKAIPLKKICGFAIFILFLPYLIKPTFANQEVKEVKGVKGVKGVKTYVLLLKNYTQKTIVLTPQRP